MFKKIVNILKTRGSIGLISMFKARIYRLLGIPAKSFLACKKMFYNKNGIEIGGASLVFSEKGIFPIYPIARQLDNANFSNTTIWEGNINQGPTFLFSSNKPLGKQYIIEATNMESIAAGTYDFVLSSHVLEHTANPILALMEWVRLLNNDGVLALILPHKDGTFDHKRPVTTMAHLIADFEAGITESDLTHMPEILTLHDLTLDPEAGDFTSFKARSLLNFENRCFHHHVFDTHLAVILLNYIGLQIITVEAIQPMHILIVAKKVNSWDHPDNTIFTSGTAKYRNYSPFPSDYL